MPLQAVYAIGLDASGQISKAQTPDQFRRRNASSRKAAAVANGEESEAQSLAKEAALNVNERERKTVGNICGILGIVLFVTNTSNLAVMGFVCPSLWLIWFWTHRDVL